MPANGVIPQRMDLVSLNFDQIRCNYFFIVNTRSRLSCVSVQSKGIYLTNFFPQVERDFEGYAPEIVNLSVNAQDPSE